LRAARIDQVAAVPSWVELLLELVEVLVPEEGVHPLEQEGDTSVQRSLVLRHVPLRCVPQARLEETRGVQRGEGASHQQLQHPGQPPRPPAQEVEDGRLPAAIRYPG